MAVDKSQIQVDGIEGSDGSSPVNISFGATVPSGQTFELQGGVTLSGILTATDANITNIQTGIVTAASFFGNGAGLTGLPSVTISKSIALYMIS